MTDEHDSTIAHRLLAAEHSDLTTFIDVALATLPTVRDDAIYWQLLAACWIKSGRVRELARWRVLFEAGRRGRWKLMKKKDRRVWRSLPSVVVAHRASAAGENLADMLSWTLDRALAERFADAWGRKVVTRRFPRDQVIAYFNRRRESEIVVLQP